MRLKVVFHVGLSLYIPSPHLVVGSPHDRIDRYIHQDGEAME